MKKGNVFLLAAGYLAGLAVAMKFNPKTAKDLEGELATSSDKYKTFGQNIVDIHKHLFDAVETSVFSEENKKRVEEYKQKFLVELEGFQQDAEVKMQEWKDKGMDKKDEMEKELKSLYARRVELMDQAKEKGVGLLDDAKDGSEKMLEDGKKVANRVFEEAKKRLDSMYADIKKKLK